MDELEQVVIDINDNDTKSVVNLNSNNDNASINNKPSVNFGGGIELLMNEKKKSSSVEIGLGELSDLENELNDLAENVNTKSLENTRSNLFNKAIDATEKNVKFQDKEEYNQKGD